MLLILLIEIYLNDEIVDTKNVTVAGGARETILFIKTFDTSGSYTARVGTESITIEIIEPEPEPEPKDIWRILGLILISVLIGVVISIFLGEARVKKSKY